MHGKRDSRDLNFSEFLISKVKLLQKNITSLSMYVFSFFPDISKRNKS